MSASDYVDESKLRFGSLGVIRLPFLARILLDNETAIADVSPFFPNNGLMHHLNASSVVFVALDIRFKVTFVTI